MADPLSSAAIFQYEGDPGIYTAQPVGPPLVLYPRATDTGFTSYGSGFPDEALPIADEAHQTVISAGGRLYTVPVSWGLPDGFEYGPGGVPQRVPSIIERLDNSPSPIYGTAQSPIGTFLVASLLGIAFAYAWSRS